MSRDHSETCPTCDQQRGGINGFLCECDVEKERQAEIAQGICQCHARMAGECMCGVWDAAPPTPALLEVPWSTLAEMEAGVARAERDAAIADKEAAEQRLLGYMDGTFSVGDGTAQKEIERLRARVTELEDHVKQWKRSASAATVRAATAENAADNYRAHYDRAAPEHNLLALLDLYKEREDEALADVARLSAELDSLRGCPICGTLKQPPCGHTDAEREAARGKR